MKITIGNRHELFCSLNWKASWFWAAIWASLIMGAHPGVAQTTVWHEDFESAATTDNWYADAGVWQIGSPTVGPPVNAAGNRAYSGSNCAGSSFNGPQYRVDSRLIGPPFTVPPATQNPRLRFWQWYEMTYNSGTVEIKVGTQDWVAISPVYTGNSGGQWTRPWLDLSAYAGQSVRLAFLFHAAGNSSTGWFIDDLAVETSSNINDMPNPETFEGGWGDWYTDFGVWQIGSPTVGPPVNAAGNRAYSGSNCAGSSFNGPQYRVDSRLIGPPFTVPPATQNPRLRFWQWYEMTYNSGTVEIKVGTQDWVAISPVYTGNSGGQWTRPWLDLSAYAGQSVRLAFLFHAAGNSSTGWFIDDLAVETSSNINDMPNPETFEGGWGDWYTDFGVWQIGSPTVGPPVNAAGNRAYSGSNCAGSSFNGPQYRVDSRLIGPPFTVPPATQNPRLRFWQWYEMTYNSGTVEIKVGTQDWVAISPVYTGNSGGQWTRPWLDLSAYAGQSVRLAFLFHAAGNSSTGWFIDDLAVETSSNINDMPNPETFEGGWGDWYTDFGVWQIGSPTVGPPVNAAGNRAYSGSNCAGSSFNGPQYRVDSRLIGPPFTVPPATQNPRLRFWQWYEMTYNSGTVEIKVGTQDWVAISPVYTGNSGGQWTRPWLDLSAYAGQSVRLAFLFHAAGNSSTGWFIDELLIQTDASPPIITTPLGNQTVVQGNSLVWTVEATGSAPLFYEWRHNGGPIANSDRISGATNSALYINPVGVADEGDYAVVVSNSVGSVTNDPPAHLTVLVPPSIKVPPQSQTVLIGADVTFAVVADGTESLSYQWQFNGAGLSGQTASSLFLKDVHPMDGGAYSVVVSNIAGVVTSTPTASLTVRLLPVPWAADDVGKPGANGIAVFTNATFTVTGSGEDMEGTADDFHFVHQTWTGDGQIVVHVTSLDWVDSQAEAGVMIRESLSSGSKHVLMAVNPSNAAIFRRRIKDDTYSWENSIQGTNSWWLRLMRMGNTFVGHYSTNGVNWEHVWFTTVQMPDQVEIGLAVTAHKFAALATAKFDNAAVSSLVPIPGEWPFSGPKLYLGGEPLGPNGFGPLGGLKLLIGAHLGDQIRVDASSDLTAWSPLATVTNQYGVVPYLDSQALTNQFRLYRAERTGP